MNTKIKFTLVVLLMLVLIIVISNAIVMYFPPLTEDGAAQYLLKHNKDLQLVIEYLSDKPNRHFYIYTSDGSAMADLEKVKVEDPIVISSVKSLFSDKCIKIAKDTERNCVDITICDRGEVSYGILYSLDMDELPEAVFMTELIPLKENRWYFYIADYNKWRKEQKTEG